MKAGNEDKISKPEEIREQIQTAFSSTKPEGLNSGPQTLEWTVVRLDEEGIEWEAIDDCFSLRLITLHIPMPIGLRVFWNEESARDFDSHVVGGLLEEIAQEYWEWRIQHQPVLVDEVKLKPGCFYNIQLEERGKYCRAIATTNEQGGIAQVYHPTFGVRHYPLAEASGRWIYIEAIIGGGNWSDKGVQSCLEWRK